MCPDVGWGEELDAVLPFLLTLAPEQDAFWIFCCIMDGSLRAYYTRAGDLEIDGELLARSLGKADSQLSHHLLTTLGIPAGKVIRGLGIRGAFVGKFRDADDGEEGIRRVWDNWLCETDGTPILIRTALTLLVHAPRREALLRVRKAEAAMNILARPIQIPPDEMAWRNSKWKINDEDLRRERQRMSKVLAEASRKKAVASVSGRGGASRGISLPTGARP
ncbi:hypothetical protein BDZ89DRAFT_113006 [Hymenopellis radicata]|nr:hypothetical protein BDZ89DRAFT_113006 [Hymenopellis radicata]